MLSKQHAKFGAAKQAWFVVLGEVHRGRLALWYRGNKVLYCFSPMNMGHPSRLGNLVNLAAL